MKNKILIILFIFLINFCNNKIFSKNININDYVYEIFVSNYGSDIENCGFGSNVEPCQTISGAFDTIVSNELKQYPINIVLYLGMYTIYSPIDITGYNLSISSDQSNSTYGDSVYTESTIYPNSDSFFVISQEVTTTINFNNISILAGPFTPTTQSDSGIIFINLPYENSYGQINGFSNYSIVINLNTLNYGNSIQIPIVHVNSINTLPSPSSDWKFDLPSNFDEITYFKNGSSSFNATFNLVSSLFDSNNPPIQINLINSSFVSVYNLIIVSPVIVSPEIPTSVTIQDCVIENLATSSQSFLKVVRGRVSIDNVSVINSVLVDKPLFDISNAEVYLKDSSFEVSVESTSVISCSGCFMNLVYSQFQTNYLKGGYDEDYATLDIKKSSITILDSEFTVVGEYTQDYSQGIVYVQNSNLNIRNSSFSSNISHSIYSDGSNTFSFWNLFDTSGSIENIVVCSKSHQSFFDGDQYFLTQFDYFSQGCNTYQNKQEAAWSLLFTFIGIGIGLVFLGLGYLIKRLFEYYKQYKIIKKQRLEYQKQLEFQYQQQQHQQSLQKKQNKQNKQKELPTPTTSLLSNSHNNYNNQIINNNNDIVIINNDQDEDSDEEQEDIKIQIEIKENQNEDSDNNNNYNNNNNNNSDNSDNEENSNNAIITN